MEKELMSFLECPSPPCPPIRGMLSSIDFLKLQYHTLILWKIIKILRRKKIPAHLNFGISSKYMTICPYRSRETFKIWKSIPFIHFTWNFNSNNPRWLSIQNVKILGQKTPVFRGYLEECKLHTILKNEKI